MNYEYVEWSSFTDSFNMTKMMADKDCSATYYYLNPSSHLRAREKSIKKGLAYYMMTLLESLVAWQWFIYLINVVRHN